MSRRYWLNLGFFDEGVSGMHEDEMARKRIMALNEDIEEGQDSQLILKTNDFEKAKQVRKEVLSILLELHLNGEDVISITAQPQCPKCGELGKFSDTYCPKCGTELLQKEYLE